MEKKSDYIEIDLGRIFKALLRRLWILVLAMVFCGAIGFSYARFFVKPTYKASALMYVNNNSLSLGTSFSLSSSDLYVSQELVETYIVIMKSRTTLNEVIDQAGLGYTYEQLYSMVSASTKDGTAIFSITVTSTDPEEAAKIANTISVVLPEKIADIVEGSSARVVDYAVVPKQKAAPSIAKYAIVGVLVGLLVSALIITIVELTNDSVRDAGMLPDTETIPVLGEIPNLGGTMYSEGFNHSHAKRKTTGRRKANEQNQE